MLSNPGSQTGPSYGKRHLPLRFLFSCIAGGFVWLFLCVGLLRAESMTLDDLVVDNANGTMTVHYGVQVHDIEAVRSALAQGLHLRFTGTATLYKKRSLWWDEFLAENVIACDLWQDVLKQEVVFRHGGEESRFPFAHLAEQLAARLHRFSLPVGSWNLIKRGNVYEIRLRLSLGREDVPAWIRIPLFFWSWDLFPDSIFQMEFSY